MATCCQNLLKINGNIAILIMPNNPLKNEEIKLNRLKILTRISFTKLSSGETNDSYKIWLKIKAQLSTRNCTMKYSICILKSFLIPIDIQCKRIIENTCKYQQYTYLVCTNKYDTQKMI